MVVIAVIAVLAAVGYPSYQDHIRKAKRSEGKAALLKTAQVLERWYSDKSTYGTSPLPPYSPPAVVPTAIDIAPLYGQALTTPIYSGENATDNKGSYRITAAAPTAACPLDACFQITATPNSPFVDAVCGNFTLTSTGTRGSVGGTGSATDACKW
jgi:type IV pilus assembly protein PilE